jgi:hypothetical protein
MLLLFRSLLEAEAAPPPPVVPPAPQYGGGGGGGGNRHVHSSFGRKYSDWQEQRNAEEKNQIITNMLLSIIASGVLEQ